MRNWVLPALSDNCIHVVIEGDAAVAVDPGAAEPVLALLQSRRLTLRGILLTHRHADHTGGVAALRAATGCEAIGPAECAAAGLTRTVVEGSHVDVAGLHFAVLAIPGHTAGHVAYHAATAGAVWTGDTLFVGGCGRVLEGTPTEMWHALLRLRGLPAETEVWCGHDYACDNLDFAHELLPRDAAIGARREALRARAAAGELPVATTIGVERRTNVFLRADDPAVGAALGLSAEDAGAVFADLRRRKDNW